MILLQIPETLFQNTLKFLADVVISETATLASVAMQALGHIGLRVPLPPLITDSNPGNLAYNFFCTNFCFIKSNHNPLIKLQLIF